MVKKASKKHRKIDDDGKTGVIGMLTRVVVVVCMILRLFVRLSAGYERWTREVVVNVT